MSISFRSKSVQRLTETYGVWFKKLFLCLIHEFILIVCATRQLYEKVLESKQLMFVLLLFEFTFISLPYSEEPNEKKYI